MGGASGTGGNSGGDNTNTNSTNPDGSSISDPNSTTSPQSGTTSGGGDGSDINTTLATIGILAALGILGAGGFFFAKKRFAGNSAGSDTGDKKGGNIGSNKSGSITIYSINSPREIVKAGKIKIDLASPEPIITLNDTVARTPAKTDCYIIQIPQKTASKLIGKDLRVVLHDKEAIHQVPDKAGSMPVYEFEVNFSDDEDDGGGGDDER